MAILCPMTRLFAAGAFLGILTGCYSFSGTTLPPHLRSLHIYPVENRTLEPSLADQITQGLDEGFRRRSNLRRVNQDGDAELYGTLIQYSHTPQSTAGSQVTSFRVDMLMQVVFVDRVKGDTLYIDQSVPGYGSYSPERGETEATARKLAVENLVKVVLDNTVLAW